MKNNQKILIYLTEVIFVLSTLMLASKKMVGILHLILKVNFISVTVVSSISVISLCILIFLNRDALKINLKWFIVLFIMLLIIFISSYTNMYFGFVTDFWNIIKSYMYVLLLIIVLSFNLCFRYKETMKKIVLFFITGQSLIGILQAIVNKPIIPIINKDGNVIVNTIYYLNGGSSTSYNLLLLGGRVRAFGITDSGLTLGLFGMLGIALIIDEKNRLLKSVLGTIYVITIYLTYTRIIWIATCVYLSLVLLNKIKIGKRIYVLGWVIQLLLVCIFSSNYIMLLFNDYPTVISRIQGIQYYINNLSLSLKNLLFGQNFVNYIDYFSKITVYTLDNELLVIVANIGIIGLVILISVYYKAMNFFKNNTVQLLLSMFSVIGIGNSVAYFYFPIICILILMKNVRG